MRYYMYIRTYKWSCFGIHIAYYTEKHHDLGKSNHACMKMDVYFLLLHIMHAPKKFCCRFSLNGGSITARISLHNTSA